MFEKPSTAIYSDPDPAVITFSIEIELDPEIFAEESAAAWR